MMRKRRIHTTLFPLCALLLVGCGGLPANGGLTLEQVARQGVVRPDGQPLPLTILGQRALPNGSQVVVYHFERPTLDGDVIELLGYREVARWGPGWQAREAGAQDENKGPTDPLIAFGRASNDGGATDGDPHKPVFVYGERLVPEVLAVEATFDNGETVRDDAGDGVFVLATTGANAVCELRVLGEHDAVLRTITEDQALAYGPTGPLPHRCQQP
jgi:hypothetical protein